MIDIPSDMLLDKTDFLFLSQLVSIVNSFLVRGETVSSSLSPCLDFVCLEPDLYMASQSLWVYICTISVVSGRYCFFGVTYNLSGSNNIFASSSTWLTETWRKGFGEGISFQGCVHQSLLLSVHYLLVDLCINSYIARRFFYEGLTKHWSVGMSLGVI